MSAAPRVQATDDTHRVTSLELFFDLVFVYAITQVTSLMARTPTWGGALQGLVILGMLWFSWASYSWLTNAVKADEGLVRIALVAAMVALFAVALAIPEAYDDKPGGLYAPLVFALGFLAVHVVHLAIFTLVAVEQTGLRRPVLGLAIPVAIGKVLLLVGAFADGHLRIGLWTFALLVEYVGVYVASASDRGGLTSAGHFAERHGLIVIIAIGESIVAIGVGATNSPLSAPVLLAVVLGLAISLVMWWTYFDVVALVAERVLVRSQGAARARLARDSYTYLHFPMVLGIVYLALGLKTVVSYVAGVDGHELGDPLPLVPLVAMYGGATLYFLAHIAFRLRNVHSVNKQRVAVVLGLLILMPFMSQAPALVALCVLAGVLVSLIGYEAIRFAEARHAVRHGSAADIARPGGEGDRASQPAPIAAEVSPAVVGASRWWQR